MLWYLSDFELYRDNNSIGYHTDYAYRYSFPFEKIGDPIRHTQTLQKYWHHSITVATLYFVMVKTIQWYMKDRKAFDLRWPLIIWDIFISIISNVTLIRFTEDFVQSMLHNGLYMSVCYSVNPHGVAAFWAAVYGTLKVLELGDTFFIVLRKRPLIFLHYYHHASAIIYTLHSGAEHTSTGRPLIFMNLICHSLMYPYYAFKAYGRKFPKYIPMTLTIIQTVQMFIGLIVIYYVYKIKTETSLPCQQSMGNLTLAVFQYSTMMILFVHFFYKHYFVEARKTKKIE